MKILFIHGLASSGAYKMADMLRMLLRADVIAPDLPIGLDEALKILQEIVADERPDLVIGLSWGGFLALELGAERTVVINPDLKPSGLLRSKIGPVQYLSPRRGGETSFEITEEICRRYEEAEKEDFPQQKTLLGCFADNDELVHSAPLFEELFPERSFHYPGGHLPTYREMKFYVVPAIAFSSEQGN